jgi:hypothetical protein
MDDGLSRRGFLRNITAASLAAFFAGKFSGDETVCEASVEPAVDFRGVRWGMSQEEVIATEDRDVFLHMPAIVMYQHSLGQLPFTLTYQFALQGNDPVCVAAVLQTNLMQNMCYIDFGVDHPSESHVEDARLDYQRIKEVLKNDLGAPIVEDAVYRDDELVQALRSHREDKSSEEQDDASPEIATCMEDLQRLSHDDATIESLMRCTCWSTARTEIRLALLPMVYGGAMLMVRHDSAELARLLPAHPDYRPA